MPYVTTREGVRAYYEQAGAGLPLVMVHGASQDTLSWQYVQEAFAADHAVFAIDLPGHGKSALWADGPCAQTARYGRFVLDFLDAAGIDRAVLMGHSMGGGVVAQAAVLAPDRVRGLVLVDGASVNVVRSSGYNPALLDMASVNPGDWFEVSFRTLMGSGADPRRVEEVVTDARRCIPAVAFGDIRAFGGFRMETLLDRIACPVVILEGEQDWSVPPESARQVERALRARKIPVEYVEWPGVGHFPQAECPEAFARDTLAAMRRLRLSP